MSALRDNRALVIGLAIVVVAGGAAGGAYWWQEHEQGRKAREAAAALLAAADNARADQVRLESAAARGQADEERAARLRYRVAQARERLDSEHPMTQCEAALQLGRLSAREHVSAIADVMSSARFTSVRVCAASALVTLGEYGTAMRAYAEWADGTDDTLKRGALSGFGEVGPAAATVALPHLERALQSPHLDARFRAIETLSKLGTAAVPLLEQASKDTDQQVREYAARALRTAVAGR